MTDRPSAPLRIAVAQFDAVGGDIAHNMDWHLRLLDEAVGAGAALAVYPELSVSGYCSDLLDDDAIAQAVDPAGDALAPLRRACAEAGIAAIVGAPVLAAGRLHLSAIYIDAAGEVAGVYHKMYLDPSERGWFEAGDAPTMVTLAGWNLGIGVCYDSSFPEHARQYALSGAQVYVLPGAFPLGRSDFRRTIYFPARALENTVYLAFSNYVGEHAGTAYGGKSAIYGPDGSCLADAGAEAGIAVHDLDHRHLEETRENLQMLKDCV